MQYLFSVAIHYCLPHYIASHTPHIELVAAFWIQLLDILQCGPEESCQLEGLVEIVEEYLAEDG